MLFTGVGVLLASKVVVLGDNIKLNYWRKKKENAQPQWKLLIAVFFKTGECRHFSNSVLSRQHTWSNESDVS